jgi:hypothetical protein
MIRHSTPRRRPRTLGTVAGRFLGAGAWLTVLLLVNVWPGWHVLPFLSAEAGSVVWLVNLCISVRIVAQLLYLLDGGTILAAATHYLIVLIDMIVAAEILLVFPFDFGDDGANWAATMRILLLTAVVVSGLRAVGASLVLAKTIRAARLAPRST